ncbi:primosomal protein DnaI [Fictibacillus sp. Mic-4]|uniref:primosomal protein DnaI n=1 Tax=Fictibacillus sp. Mic-4 TaxID=3132826 RepID=UPI003CF3B26D
MESIKESFKQIPGYAKFQKDYNALKFKVLNDPTVASFIESHPELTQASIERSLPRLFEYIQEQANCANCPGLANCPNMMKGYQPKLGAGRNTIDLSYEKCELKLQEDKQKSIVSLIKSYFIPKEILEATFDKLHRIDKERKEAIFYATQFVTDVCSGKETKGLYFYGKFGVGKTFLLGAIANKLAERQVQSLIVHTPEFLREIKNSLSEGTFQEKMDLLKKVPVLMLDDIGAENMSPWIRDEVLGVILQFRMMEKLPTLYSSNFDFDLLQEHFYCSEKSGLEEAKAKRIMERIRHITIPVFIGGSKNFRTLS